MSASPAPSQTFRVHELFYTLQGEGAHTGRAAVFCRFAGCNLWSGREADRASALCRFCDTDFQGVNGSGGGVFTEASLVEAIEQTFSLPVLEACRRARVRPYVVFTGGEPALQLTQSLIDTLHTCGFALGVESNGTLPLPQGLDWITISPKAGTILHTTSGHELKLVWPQPGSPADFTPESFEQLNFERFTLQPCDDPNRKANTAACIAYCLAHPQWHFGLQAHKYIGVR